MVVVELKVAAMRSVGHTDFKPLEGHLCKLSCETTPHQRVSNYVEFLNPEVESKHREIKRQWSVADKCLPLAWYSLRAVEPLDMLKHRIECE